MPARTRYGLFIALMIMGLLVAWFGGSHAATTYTYDELNRLRIVDYGDGTVIEYTYDGAGNRLTVQSPAPPTGTITINSGAACTNNRNVMLTLSCTASQGCSLMKFSNDNITYSAPETYATTKAWTLTPGDGSKIVYVMFKDTLGRWSTTYSDTIQLDTTPPVTTPAPPGGSYISPVTVTLSCSDGTGSGCDKIYYTIDGTDPNTSSPVYTSPIYIPVPTTLKFFAKDHADNSEAVHTENYIITDTTAPTTTASPPGGIVPPGQTVVLTCNDGTGSGCEKTCYTDGSTPTCPTCPNIYSTPIPVSDTTLKFFSIDHAQNCEATKTEVYTLARVMIGSVPYPTLQAAYDAAANGDTIKCRELTFTESLTVNRNITVTLDGGYDTGFTTNNERMTSLKGMITTTAGGGTITIRNFTLTQ